MKLAIYGAGGLGREVLILAQIINADKKRWDDFIFIDDINPKRELKGFPVLDFDVIKQMDDVEIVIAVGEPKVRMLLAEKVKNAELALTTLIHPRVHLSPCTTIGKGVVLCQGVFVSCDVVLRDNVFLQPNSSVGHDAQIDEHSILSTYVTLGGKCHIGARAFIGMSAAIKESTTIGDDTIIGMGAVVLNDIESSVIALGNPARVMRKNEDGKVFR
ncbi:NeuD/PglB/VioB family sugar acetyltransferase [Pectobacterium aroidearum]|uniref:NeuD/PglB/VioB family sugar acetyltransferase n=1 Tax=Pectobacterium aroidearum TaxID=1201031 RepID=A0ABR5ZAI2_9GAMM|nr:MULTISPECIES: NeuD/PglB/VioB family sugar acetyltransferase [Pectobacterium]MBA5198799.1 NeuD/PglB/VioB family sugar acetyltransferase [Pectobacterium aroidearum]MBA5226698.1 NeuD/PglB/VioB family sugar acetyltransferase [Pectobacterium aroidearum]MBA5231591.1 NeuD/PglB/VioB family sugar acetyltransferase [Pectobacterium aroidearum]MBA5736736.1 NeuD/PglB/VioB family sugar acetyltransferase [Pectobacterium aroidearum]UUE56202.1 NeuD/PglB/VioB family sugar acetyltransferase [Pectobacterium ar